MLARGSVDHCGAGTAAIFGRSRDDPAAANPATPLLTLRWTFSAKRACVVITDSEPDRLARVTGVLHVQAQTCAKRKVVSTSKARSKAKAARSNRISSDNRSK